jgi:lipopolysaccharide/colanic/teichoic acid biosynthesis glycosyltransferase
VKLNLMDAKFNRSYERAKRCTDVLLAVCALILTAPVWLAIAALIKFASPGPLLFVQRRVGKDLQSFYLLKFRTMHVRPPDGADSTVTTRNDPRIFRGARWLRRSKLDELPQLLNVLAGSMSLVGPRPTVQSDYDRMTSEQQRRAEVLPGLTGLAQIRGGAAVPWPVRLTWDLRYVRERSSWLDLAILAETVWLLLRGQAPGEAASHDEWNLEGAAEA